MKIRYLIACPPSAELERNSLGAGPIAEPPGPAGGLGALHRLHPLSRRDETISG